MKDLKEQISNRCIHFNGVMNEKCEAGITYSSVRVGKPYKFPCLKQDGKCSMAKFPSAEEVDKEIAEINSMTEKINAAYTKIKFHYESTNELQGVLACDCGGKLKFSIAKSNGHIWAMCKTCGIYFNE